MYRPLLSVGEKKRNEGERIEKKPIRVLYDRYFADAFVVTRKRSCYYASLVTSARLAIWKPVVAGSAFVALGAVVALKAVAQPDAL